MKKFFKVLSVTIALVLLLFFLRKPILRTTGNSLIKVNDPTKVHNIYVLSGNPYDRGRKALEIYNQGYGTEIVCTGENIASNINALGKHLTEGQLTEHYLKTLGFDTTALGSLPIGTSTKEEVDAIIAHLNQTNQNQCIVVTSLFHTRRVRKVFKKNKKQSGIEAIIIGAPSSTYDETAWWKSEQGLIAVNNEYLKLFYYWLKGY